MKGKVPETGERETQEEDFMKFFSLIAFAYFFVSSPHFFLFSAVIWCLERNLMNVVGEYHPGDELSE